MNKKRANIETVFAYVKENYGTLPEYLWLKSPDSAIFRCTESSKWYGAVLKVKRKVIGIEEDGEIYILNIKCNPLVKDCLIKEGKAYPAYHMNKKYWVSIPLDGSLYLDEISGAIDESYQLVK